ncbi:hypothetical protein F0344_10435 [Streptomyces finlayi]|uniref:Uncharacterized protein n=1 Tax=Streptomyces finlayi TaxID=67296 RepID=A0A7G7BI12_9ACTN|nr:hypothetical protein F0344_10435 [Streptomyces finlayi]
MVGRDARVTGGLRRHGGNRPLPLHKVMDSGNQGYAPPAVTCSPGLCSSRTSHRKPGFGTGNGGKQAGFRCTWGTRQSGYGHSTTTTLGKCTQNVPFRFELYVNLAAGGLPEE